MESETEPRAVALYEAFTLWLSEPMTTDWSTGELAKVYANATLKSRELVLDALNLIPARKALFERILKAKARDHRRQFRVEMDRALNDEHFYGCEGNACDVSTAHKHGCIAWAAHLLIGATEAPATTEAFVKYASTFLEPGEFENHLNQECKELLEVPHVTCESCNAVLWEIDTKRGDRCSSCGTMIPGHVEDEDE